MSNRVLRVLPKKTKRTGKTAVIPIHRKLYARLAALGHDESGYVLPRLAERYKHGGAKREVIEVFRNAGIETYEIDANGRKKITTGFHALRHYFISNCVRQGIPINVVQQMAAHSSASMSLEYAHVQEHDLTLPDYDGDTVKIRLKKSTIEALDKARGVHDMDDFLMNLLANKPMAFLNVRTQQDIELDNLVDELIS